MLVLAVFKWDFSLIFCLITDAYLMSHINVRHDICFQLLSIDFKWCELLHNCMFLNVVNIKWTEVCITNTYDLHCWQQDLFIPFLLNIFCFSQIWIKINDHFSWRNAIIRCWIHFKHTFDPITENSYNQEESDAAASSRSSVLRKLFIFFGIMTYLKQLKVRLIHIKIF